MTPEPAEERHFPVKPGNSRTIRRRAVFRHALVGISYRLLELAP
jgi:hypothetical protein